MIDKRPNIAGNVYTEQVEGIHVHKYGAHIFHTNNKEVWDYVNRFAEFNRFTNSPGGELSRRAVFPALQHVYLQPDVGRGDAAGGAAKIEEQKGSRASQSPGIWRNRRSA